MPTLILTGLRGSFPEDRATGVWSSPLTPFGAEIRNVTLAPPYVFMAWYLIRAQKRMQRNIAITSEDGVLWYLPWDKSEKYEQLGIAGNQVMMQVNWISGLVEEKRYEGAMFAHRWQRYGKPKFYSSLIDGRPMIREDLRICNYCTLVQVFVSGHYPSSCLYFKKHVSETGFCRRLQVKPNQ
jgi:hypothetical protein